MASTTLSLHLRRNALLKNPNSIKFFSSSSSSFPNPPPNDTNETTPSPQPRPKSSYREIRERLIQLRMNKAAEVNKGTGNGNSMLSNSKLTDTDSAGKGGEMSDIRESSRQLTVNKGTGNGNSMLSQRLIKLRDFVEKEAESNARAYKSIIESLQELASEIDDKKSSTTHVYGDSGEKLRMLRPEEPKEKEAESDTRAYKGIRESLQKLASETDDKKKTVRSTEKDFKKTVPDSKFPA